MIQKPNKRDWELLLLRSGMDTTRTRRGMQLIATRRISFNVADAADRWLPIDVNIVKTR